jgi:hypothetical protein
MAGMSSLVAGRTFTTAPEAAILRQAVQNSCKTQVRQFLALMVQPIKRSGTFFKANTAPNRTGVNPLNRKGL